MIIIDETNNQYGSLKVIKRDQKKTGRKYWICKCQKCNKEFSISGTDLRTGRKTDCPDCHDPKKEERQKNINKRFGKLTVIDFAYTATDRHLVWKCRCDCGREENIKGSLLISGKKTCCTECNKKNRKIQYIDETGNQYGRLTVLEYDNNKSQSTAWWKCKCKCGNIISVPGIKLRAGRTQSCGCMKSYGEEKIIQILQDNNILFKTQITFPDCKDINLLKFDFGIYDKNNKLQYLIEYDGKQHFQSGTGWNTEENFEKIKRRDKIKNNYCKQNNIPLIRIPYTKYDTLNISDLLYKGE